MAELKIFTLRDIQAERTEWLWNPYIPYGKITIVQGDPGEGKTTLMLAIAAAVTTGAALPGGYRVFPGSVLVQTAEDGLADTIKPRLEQLGADCSCVHVIDEGEQALSFADERIEQAIIKTGAKLLIFDPLQAYLGGADMHRANGMRPLLKHLGTVAERTGCAIVIIGHLNKKGGKAQYRGLGSIDIYAAARSVLTVGRLDAEGTTRVVVHDKSNLAPSGPTQAFKLDPESGFSWLGECDIESDDLFANRKPAEHKTSSESKFQQACRLIETALANESVPALEMMQLAEEQNISEKTMHRAKRSLDVISEKIHDQWHWMLPTILDIKPCPAAQEVSQHGQDSRAYDLAVLTAMLQGEDYAVHENCSRNTVVLDIPAQETEAVT